MFRIASCIFALISLISNSARCDTTWVAAGSISGHWIATDSPYVIHEGTVTVASGQVLQIDPGVIVYFTGSYRFEVRGTLNAIGTEADSIKFTTDTLANPGRWLGVRFLAARPETRFEYCVVEYGRAWLDGDDRYGGCAEIQSCGFQIRHCTFRGGRAAVDGGGIYIRDNASPVIEDCLIENCYAGVGGGGMLSRLSAVTIRRCLVRQNWTAGDGGGIHMRNESDLVLEDSRVENNMARSGGGLYFTHEGSTVVSARCSFSHNIAVERGGSVYGRDWQAQFENCIFAFSLADSGGAVYSSTSGSSDLVFRHCTIYGSSAGVGSGVWSHGAGFESTNCIISESSQSTALNISEPDTVIIRGCDFFTNPMGNFTGAIPDGVGIEDSVNANSTPCDHYGNIFDDPQFVDPTSADFHLMDMSPCIAAGYGHFVDNDFEESARPSPAFTEPDMGAFESEIGDGLYACGSISGNIGPGDVIIGCDVTIEADDTLTVMPGTHFLARGRFVITVYGLLRAQGTVTDSIYFTSDTLAGNPDWKGVHFFRCTPTWLSYCVIEKARSEESGGFEGQGGFMIHGDGIHMNGSTFEHCTIRNNYASWAGGGISVYYTGLQVISSVVVSNESARHGGGILVGEGGQIWVIDSDVGYNTAALSGGGIASYELGIWNSRFHHNSARSGGGAWLGFWGGTVLTSQFDSNFAADAGGGIICGGHAWIDTCQFIANVSAQGGGMHLGLGAEVHHSIFVENVATLNGGAICFDFSNSRVVQCTISRNTSPNGAGCAVLRGLGAVISSSIISNNWGYGLYFQRCDTSRSYRHCNVYGNTASNWAFSEFDTVLTDFGFGELTTQNLQHDSSDAYYNISFDPQFLDTVNGDYRVSSRSLCIDAGDPSLPVDPDGSIADIGAFWTPWQHLPPESFGLGLPANFDTVQGESMVFCWERANDLRDTVRYRLVFTADDSVSHETAVFAEYNSGTDTCSIVDFTAIEHGRWDRFYWFVLARDTRPDTVISSLDTFTVVWNPPPPPHMPTPFDLVSPANFDTVRTDSQLFCWHAAVDIDSGEVLRYTLQMIDESGRHFSVSSEADTCVPVNFDSLAMPDSLLIAWHVELRTDFPDTNTQSVSTWYFYLARHHVSAGEWVSGVPADFSLSAVYPNPFNAITTIDFSLPRMSAVRVEAYDIGGRQAAILVDRRMEPGFHSVVFDAQGYASGVYFLRMEAGDFSATRKLLLLK